MILAAIFEIIVFLNTFLSFSGILKSVILDSKIKFYSIKAFTSLNRRASRETRYYNRRDRSRRFKNKSRLKRLRLKTY